MMRYEMLRDDFILSVKTKQHAGTETLSCACPLKRDPDKARRDILPKRIPHRPLKLPNRILAVLLLLLPLVWASAAEHGAFGVHGMVLIGEKSVVLSHLPLYQAPHNFQVVIEVEISTEHKQLLDELRGQWDGIITVEPENFDLFRLMPGNGDPLTRFRGSFYRGHFERGGSRFMENVEFRVSSNLLFRELDSQLTDTKDGVHMYWLGTEKESYLIHKIGAKPNFDQVLLVESTFGDNNLGGEYVFASQDEKKLLTVSRSLTSRNNYTFDGIRQVYLEVADLAQ